MKQITVRISATNSAATIDSQIPSSPQIIGKTSTAMIWHTKVRIKEIAAEISPLLSAVNMELPKMLKPHSKNERE